MKKTGRKNICGAPTTLAVKGLMMMMMMIWECKLIEKFDLLREIDVLSNMRLVVVKF